MSEKTNIPQIRFKGFNDVWEQCKLGDLGEFRSNGVDKLVKPNEVPVNLLNYMDVYNRRNITNANVSELMQVTAKPQQLRENNVLMGDVYFTPTSETADDIGHVMVIEENLVNTVYSYHLMRYRPYKNEFYLTFPNYSFATRNVRKQMELAAQGVQRFVINKNKFEELLVLKPSLLEQEKISKLLTNLDNLITLHQRKHEKYTNIKKALLEKMFPQNGEKAPQIRFKGFTEAWEQCELWELTTWDKKFNEVEDIKQPKVIKYPYVLADVFKHIEDNNGNVVLLSTGTYVGHTTEDLAGKNLCNGEIVAIPWGGSPNVKYCNGKFVTADNRIATSNDKNKLDNKYLYYWLTSNLKYLETIYRGASIKHPSMSDVLNMIIKFPKLHEQQLISKELECLDNLITLHQRECEKLKNIKKSLLEKMFV